MSNNSLSKMKKRNKRNLRLLKIANWMNESSQSFLDDAKELNRSMRYILQSKDMNFITSIKYDMLQAKYLIKIKIVEFMQFLIDRIEQYIENHPTIARKKKAG